MSIPPRDTSKKGTVTRSQAKNNQILAKETEETSQGPPKRKQKLEKSLIITLRYQCRKTANIEQALDSLKRSHPYSTSRKFNRKNRTNNLPSETVINNLPNSNLPTQPTEINLPTKTKFLLRLAKKLKKWS